MGSLKIGSKSKSKSGGFQYKGRSKEDVKERAQRKLGNREGYLKPSVVTFTPKVGDNTVRILPPTFDGKHYGMDLWAHYSIGPDEDAFLCLDKMNGEKCPICDERVKAAESGDEDYAYELRPRGRVGVYVIDRSQESKGPMLWNMPAGLDKDIVNLSVDKKSGEIYEIDNPEEGYDISFTREGTDKKTKYTGIQIARRSSPLSDDEDDANKWLEYITENSLPDTLVFHEYDYIQDAFKGTVSPKDKKKEEEDDDPPKKKFRKRGEEEEETPAPKKSKKKVEEEEQDDEPEKPTWEELEEMDEEQLGEIGDAFELEFPEDAFEDADDCRKWVAEQLEIEMPKPKKKAAEDTGKKGNWKDRLAAMKSKK